MYVLGWLLSGVGFVLLLIGAMTAPPVYGVLVMAALLLLIFGLSSAAGYQIVSRRHDATQAYKGPSPLLLFGILLATANIASVVLRVFGVTVAETATGFLTGALILLAGYAGVVWLFGFRSGAIDRRSIRMPPGEAIGKLIGDVALGSSTMLLVAILAGLWGRLIALLLDTSAPQVVPVPTAGIDVLVVVVAACVVVPIGEELFFRGYAMAAWLPDLGERSALIRSTVFFAAIHILNITVDPAASDAALTGLKQAALELLVIGPVGLALGVLFLRRGLLAAISGHAMFNLLGVVALLVAQSQS